MVDGSESYQVPLMIRANRRILRFLFRGIFRVLCRIRLVGLENIPPYGAYVVAYNHISLVEPPFVLAFWPHPPEAVGAADVWERRFQSTLVRMYGTVPVHRGEMDRRLIRTMLSILESNRPLIIAPEGGRTHTPGLRKGWPGVGYLIAKARAPVVPVGIVGSTSDMLPRALRGERPMLEMRIGLPVDFPPESRLEGTSRMARRWYTDQVMAHIAALLPPDYQGEYATLAEALPGV